MHSHRHSHRHACARPLSLTHTHARIPPPRRAQVKEVPAQAASWVQEFGQPPQQQQQQQQPLAQERAPFQVDGWAQEFSGEASTSAAAAGRGDWADEFAGGLVGGGEWADQFSSQLPTSGDVQQVGG